MPDLAREMKIDWDSKDEDHPDHESSQDKILGYIMYNIEKLHVILSNINVKLYTYLLILLKINWFNIAHKIILCASSENPYNL